MFYIFVHLYLKIHSLLNFVCEDILIISIRPNVSLGPIL